MRSIINVAVSAVFAATMCVLAPSCTCKTVMPQIVQATTLVAEASQALSQVDSLIVLRGAELDPPKRKQLLEYVTKARDALRVAEMALNTASDTCRSPDYVALFKQFNEIWALIKPFLPMLSSGQVGLGEPVVKDPAVFGYR